MRKDDYQIAHCFTRETHRGKNIYPYVLKYITKKEKGNAVMFIKDGNKASEHGVVKAGFAKYAGGGNSKEFFKNILYVETIKFFTSEELVVKRKADQIFRNNKI